MLKKLTRKHWIIALLLVIVIAVFGYYFSKGSSDDDNNATVTGTALVSVVSAQTVPFSPTISAYGTIGASSANAQIVSLQGTGTVQSIAVMPYTAVKKGQKLIAIAPTPDVEATLENTRANLKRQEALRQSYLATNADVEAAQATLTSLQAQYGNGTKWMLAPSDGIVGAIMAQPGQVVTGGVALFNFSKTTNIGASLGIAIAERSKIQVGNTVDLQVENNPGLHFKGKVTSIASQLNDQSGLIDVQVSIDKMSSGQSLIVNTPVQAEIATSVPAPRILLPRDSVLYQDKQAYVFIDHDNKAEYRNVVVAGENSQDVAIESGISVGELVVTSGNYELQDGMHLAVQGSSS